MTCRAKLAHIVKMAALTQLDLDRLEAAAAHNVLEIREGDNITKFETIGDLMKRIEFVRKTISEQSSAPRQATRYPTFVHSRERF